MMEIVSERIIFKENGLHYVRNVDRETYDWSEIITWSGPYNLKFAYDNEKKDFILASQSKHMWKQYYESGSSRKNWLYSQNYEYDFKAIDEIPELEEKYQKLLRKSKFERLIKTNKQTKKNKL